MSVMAIDHLELFRERAANPCWPPIARSSRLFSIRGTISNGFRPPAGTVFFPRLTRGDPQEFLKLLREKYETSVVPGEFFEMPRHFRLGIGGDTAGLRASLERLSAALDEFARR